MIFELNEKKINKNLNYIEKKINKIYPFKDILFNDEDQQIKKSGEDFP